MNGLQWFRVYTDFLNDPKMVSIAFEDQRHFIAVLALKAEGVLDQDCDEKILDRIVAQRIWVDYSIIQDVKKRLVNAGLITEDWQPKAWEQRQMQSDSSTERVRKYREKKKQEELEKQQVKGCNDDVTVVKRFSNGLEKNREDSNSKDSGYLKGSGAISKKPDKSKPPPKKAHRLPDDWKLGKKLGEWALQQRPDLDREKVLNLAEQFRDYWHAESGRKAMKLDWDAAFRTWVRKDWDMHGDRRLKNGKQPKFDPIAAGREEDRRTLERHFESASGGIFADLSDDLLEGSGHARKAGGMEKNLACGPRRTDGRGNISDDGSGHQEFEISANTSAFS